MKFKQRYLKIDLLLMRNGLENTCPIDDSEPVWPVEVILALVDQQRRIGDYLASTKVVDYDPTAKALNELEWAWK
jgi:hypothetical protein